METLLDLVLLFFVFSFLGWCIEVTLKYRQYHRFINRGFLAGPWLPIYGSGAVLITLAMRFVSRWDDGYGATFAVSFFLCGALEYGASWVMEKRFHARWWDYSKKPMNLHGRVWIGNLILFGLGGVLIVHVFDPLLYRRQCHVVAIGALQIVFVAHHRLVHLPLKLNVDRLGNILCGETALQLRTGFGHVAYRVRRFAQHNEFPDFPLYLPYGKWPVLVDDVGQA